MIVVNVFNPDRGGGGAIFSDLCYGLAELGYDVTVRCAYPYYPEWRDKSGRNGLAIERYEEKGVHVERYGLFIPSSPRSLIQRLLYEASFFLSVSRSLPRGKPFDLVMVYCPLVGAVAFAAVNRLLHRQPLWLNVQDLSADAAAASGIARGQFIKRLLGIVQSIMFNQAGVWSSISPVMIDRLKRIRRRHQPILYLPNWLNNSMAIEIARQPSKCGRTPQHPVKLLYAGNIGGKQDLIRFCEVLHDSNVDFIFRIHGNGAEATFIQSWISRVSDRRFEFGPFLEEEDFACALYNTDFFVITEKTASGGSFIPCKMIAGIASGSPILAVCDLDSPLGQEMRNFQIGPCFSWNVSNKVLDLIQNLAKSTDTFVTWQENALNRAMFYTRKNMIRGFDTALHTIWDKRGQVLETFDNIVLK